MILALKEELKYKRRLIELRTKYNNCLEEYSVPLRDAKKGNPNVFRELLAERDAVCLEDELQLKRHISNHLLAKASRLHVVKPDLNDMAMWEEQFRDEYLVLSERGLAAGRAHEIFSADGCCGCGCSSRHTS